MDFDQTLKQIQEQLLANESRILEAKIKIKALQSLERKIKVKKKDLDDLSGSVKDIMK